MQDVIENSSIPTVPQRSKNAIHNSLYRKRHPEKIKEYAKRAYWSKVERNRARNRKYQSENREKILAKGREYYWKNRDLIARKRKANKEKFRQYARNQRLKNPVVASQRCRVYREFKKLSLNKPCHSLELMGCDAEFLKSHIEKQFKCGMSWGNYGYRGWHVDHIRPICSFDLSDPQQHKAAFHYSNLQPMWGRDNFAKGGKWEGN